MYMSHRQRLRSRALDCGIYSLETYRLLELYLFDLLPRIDTYPAAHRLLDRFGTVDGVFSASRDELLEVFGIGPKSADHITATGEIIERVVLDAFTTYPLDTEIKIYPVLSWLMRNMKTDGALVLALRADLSYLDHRKFPTERASEAVCDYIKAACETGAERYVFAHRHPEKYKKPSPEDINTTESIAEFCCQCGAELVEHYISTDSGIIAISEIM